MDPSGFNMNRLGNVEKSLDEWRDGKPPKRPVWGPLIVLLILVGIVLLVFFH